MCIASLTTTNIIISFIIITTKSAEFGMQQVERDFYKTYKN